MTKRVAEANPSADQARSLWAKSDPFHPLWCHLIDVAVVARLLTGRFGGIPQLPDGVVSLIAGLHDLGKADEWFQNKDADLAQALRQRGVLVAYRDDSFLDGHCKFRHEARSAAWVQRWLADNGWGKFAAPVLSAAIHGHHGQFSTNFIYAEEDARLRDHWDGLRHDLLALLIDVLKPPICRVERFDDASNVGAKLSGLIVLADWIASNHEVYRYDRLPQTSEPHEYHRAAEEEARLALQRLEFDQAPENPVSKNTSTQAFSDVWPESKNWTLRPIQTLLQSLCQNNRLPPGLVIIEAPMGEGKTEAAIYLAECWNRQSHRTGCYLALPTQATANQIHHRYTKFLAQQRPQSSAPRLVHGMSWLMDNIAPDGTPQTYGDDERSRHTAQNWFRPARRALLATDGVGTVDQALMAALNVKFGFLRLLGLSAKTLIIDEVHAYDDFMTTIMERLLAWCRTLQIPVVLLSATLSQEQKRTLCAAYAGDDRSKEVSILFDRWPSVQTPYPLITSVPLAVPSDAYDVKLDQQELTENRNTEVRIHLHPGLLDDVDQTASVAVQTIANGGCACVLANTVKCAQAIFEHLLLQQAGSLEGVTLLLFHARFPAARRSEIEENVTRLFGKNTGTERPRRAIVVATQVVEQSLDVDFDVMLSQVAPVDLLLQRSGRVWRHKRPASERHGMHGPVLHVLTPPESELKFGATERVYEREILLRTMSLLYHRTAFHLPPDFRELIEGCYDGGPLANNIIAKEEILSAAEQRRDRRSEARAKARTHLLPNPSSRNFNPCRESADEGEGEAHSYFVAQTRMGDESLSVLLLDDEQLLAVARSSCERDAKPPARNMLKQIFLQKVGLPRWWLMTTVGRPKRMIPSTPADGFSEFFIGGAWLRNQVVLPLRGGEWRGKDAHGREFLIRNNHQLGVTRELINPESKNFNERSQEEADAGQLG